MKTMKGFLVILAALLVFAGCGNPLLDTSLSPPSNGTGNLVLRIAGVGYGRTILPATTQSNFNSYTLTFTGTGAPTDPIERTNADLSDPVNLNAGTYNLTVTAYMDIGRTQPTASATVNGIVIDSGAVTPVAVELTAINDAGNGTFAYTIIYTGITLAGTGNNVTVTPYPAGTAVSYPAGATGVQTTQSLASGYYNVKVELVNAAGQKAVREDVLHIYQNMTSEITWTFTAANFFADLTGAVTITGGTTVDSTLTAAVTGSNGAGTPVYQWYRTGTPDTPIGTNSSTYTVAAADLGNDISVTVTYDGYNGIIKSANFTIPGFIAVTNITDLPDTAVAGTPLLLTGTVNPTNATNQTITWSINNAGSTGAALIGTGNDTLTFTAAGTATITATVVNGITNGTANYTQNFTITVQQPVTFTITFNQIADLAPAISDITVSRTGAGGASRTGTISINDPDGDYLDIIWYIDGNRISGFDDQKDFVIDTEDSTFFYYGAGDHNITLEVVRNGVPYSKTIVFSVTQ